MDPLGCRPGFSTAAQRDPPAPGVRLDEPLENVQPALSGIRALLPVVRRARSQHDRSFSCNINSSGRSTSCMAQAYPHVLWPAGLPPN